MNNAYNVKSWLITALLTLGMTLFGTAAFADSHSATAEAAEAMEAAAEETAEAATEAAEEAEEAAEEVTEEVKEAAQ